MALPIGVVTEEFYPREGRLAVERAEERVQPLGRGEAHVEIEVEPRRELADLLLAVVVEGNRGSPIAERLERREDEVLLAEEGETLVERPALVERPSDLERRARRVNRALAAIDIDLGARVVWLRFVARVRLEHLRVVFDRLGARRHFPRRLRLLRERKVR